MDVFVFVVSGWIAIILLVEGVMWSLFRRRASGICFPRDVRGNPPRCISLTLFRVCALLHTVMMIGVTVTVYILLW